MGNEEKVYQNNKFQWIVLIILVLAWVVRLVIENIASRTIQINFSYLFIFSIVFLLYYLIGKVSPIKLFEISGVKKPKALDLVLYSVGFTVIALAICSLMLPEILNIKANEVLKITGYYSRYDRYSIMSMTTSKLLIIVSLAAFYVYQTFFEELIFRGIILRKLLSKFNVLISNIIHAIIFGSVHIIGVLTIPNLPTNMKIFMLVSPTIGGLLLGYAYAKTDNNLTVPWLLHFLVNLTPDLLFVIFNITIMPT
jgi:membrane protease YdiL (CAAX protease family)